MPDENGLNELVRQIGEVPRQVGPKLRQAVEHTAFRIKKQISDEYNGSRNLPSASGSITYEIRGTTGAVLGGISAEIGPDLNRRQGPVVGMVDVGTPRTPGRQRIPKALADNEEDFDRGIQKAVEDGMSEAGLTT
jgi:hypothetical protein